jgi:hypothetical protein
MNIQEKEQKEKIEREINDLEEECRRLGINVSQAVVGDGPF